MSTCRECRYFEWMVDNEEERDECAKKEKRLRELYINEIAKEQNKYGNLHHYFEDSDSRKAEEEYHCNNWTFTAGYCKRMPPQAIPNPETHEKDPLSYVGVWPEVGSFNNCGEFKEKDKTERKRK